MAATFPISVTSHEAIVDVYEFLPRSPIPCFLVIRRDLSLPEFLNRLTQTFIPEGPASSAALPLFSCNSVY